MEKGLSLIELLLAMAAASMLILILYDMDLLSVRVHSEMRDSWFCMQSLRSAALQLHDDMIQAACLLPQDLKIGIRRNELFIAGVPVTSDHKALGPSSTVPPPYYSLILSAAGTSIVLDTVDIDEDGKEDYWADMGIITDKGPCRISHTYSRGNLIIPVDNITPLLSAKKAVPAIRYALKSDGLYRNDQLLAESIVSFEPKIESSDLTILLKARYNGKEKDMLLPYTLP